MCLQAVGAALSNKRIVTACLLHNEPTSYSSLARLSTIRKYGAAAKASPNRAKFESVGVDAKLCDLPMGRMKVW